MGPSINKKKSISRNDNWKKFLAGVVGIEPTQTVLETVVLPLYDTPILSECTRRTKNRELFALGMGGVLLAEAAVLREGKLLLYLLFVALRVVGNTPASTTLEFCHVVFDLAHTLP
jgi:hypothetical protein